MSTIRLLRDHESRIEHQDRKISGKKGDVISVPFTLGREMIAAGEASYATVHQAKRPAPTPIHADPAPQNQAQQNEPRK